MIIAQAIAGALLAAAGVFGADYLAAAFIPRAQRAASIGYVRICALGALSSTVEVSDGGAKICIHRSHLKTKKVAVAESTRALDKPDISLLISTIKLALNIFLDVLFVSRFHILASSPTIMTQALVRFACNMAAAFGGLGEAA